MIDRREFFLTVASLAGSNLAVADAPRDDRVLGMLLGSLVGDALGGPIEFADASKLTGLMPSVRNWDDRRRLGESDRVALAESLQMHAYDELRPEPAAYGPWRTSAPAGTLTDDSRHKIILMRAVRDMLAERRHRLRQQDLATQLVRFQPHRDRPPDPALAALVAEGLREYRLAASWVLGERDPRLALPVERLWGGISNCSGQMMLIPLAGVFPGQPETAYRVTFELDFIDAPIARDIAAALNAALAAVLDASWSDADRETVWKVFFETLRRTDPYRLAAVPFAGRPLLKWLDLADSIVERCGGRPAEAFRLLESEGKPVYYWDAHFTLLVPITLLKLCQYDCRAAMQLTLDFGHDTDSYAQVLGAIAGAVEGPAAFPESMRRNVANSLERDFGESVDDWRQLLDAAARVYSD